MNVKTAFSVVVNGELKGYDVKAVGQEAAKSIKDAFPPTYRNELVVILLDGFIVNDVFIAVDLS